ncbi:MogA/MoaB family molybdenum cofactor biosynthesis protein [Lederbergia citrea]|uniref:MogA/MoaB family molybdenum cofactor biosynthesis protein n=1 Tax=Lederbergia citrea TaxID=2833581 RepID=UPI001BCA5CC1|nr:molybdenum cofactor biosynthesis protein B [Lederbergia citrea]MBS4176041.1 molybdenum cofactor biosynthesis protein MoaB [Lederbergia citrea]MBS4202603.1 molybdenum cofactor biosynthesis protein MoaB [Lederbergia citrea]
MSVEEHKSEAPVTIGCAVITVSDTRTDATDKSGKLLKELLIENGHNIPFYKIVKDDPASIKATVEEAISTKEVSTILMTGGTGIAKRDVTIETVSTLFEKEIVGFGELFRMLSYLEDIGSAAMMSRASAGIYRNKAIFIMPGSSGAVKLAMEKLILKEMGHVVRELNK